MCLDWLHEFGREPREPRKTGNTERLRNEEGAIVWDYFLVHNTNFLLLAFTLFLRSFLEILVREMEIFPFLQILILRMPLGKDFLDFSLWQVLLHCPTRFPYTLYIPCAFCMVVIGINLSLP